MVHGNRIQSKIIIYDFTDNPSDFNREKNKIIKLPRIYTNISPLLRLINNYFFVDKVSLCQVHITHRNINNNMVHWLTDEIVKKKIENPRGKL